MTGVQTCALPILKEALHDISVRRPLKSLIWDEGIASACTDHVIDLGPKGKVDHIGTDGSTVYERMNRYGKHKGMCGENFQIGLEDPEEIIISMLIDSKNEKKVHRRTMLESKFKKGALCIGNHSKYGIWTVFAYSEQFT